MTSLYLFVMIMLNDIPKPHEQIKSNVTVADS